jgi:hypothetical protein
LALGGGHELDLIRHDGILASVSVGTAQAPNDLALSRERRESQFPMSPTMARRSSVCSAWLDAIVSLSILFDLSRMCS